MRLAKVAAVFVACSCVGAIQASVVFTLGNNPQPHEENVLLTNGETGTSVFGTTNISGTAIEFSSSQVLLSSSSGQGAVGGNPDGTPLTNIEIAGLLQNIAFADLIINPFIGGCALCTPGPATVTVQSVIALTGQLEPPAVFTYDITNGQNFLTITTSNGEAILSTSITNSDGFGSLRQTRVSGAVEVVPEPATYTYMGLGLGLTALLRRRRGM